ncbi:fimbrial biogenesis chaperone [Lelliottia sp. CFBP8978]|jgi:fimbrial chaperone protein|uniref:fimbrial biogenesis chaperone n=1 Tax=Lelliottia sp. CFBP8978 TaxID=3096522 RepID=UPI002A6B5148|nr:fimbria/pilus periplasmic chaperone [Lelliottia sp. CFBP8978]MDY1038555.1 fimbria/pilus periplasmic chaperone [Lelliottia sp. CFBP8978]
MKLHSLPVIACLLFSIHAAHAGVVVGGTRVIYDGAKKESSLRIENPDKSPYLIQSWVEATDSGAKKAPFVITPPLFRLDGEQKNILRIVQAGGLPQNQESLFWLNIKSIPYVAKKDNTLQIAIKTRIKLIYRPDTLKSNSEATTNELRWQHAGNKIQVSNPTNYYMNFNSIKVNGKALSNVTFVAPHATAQFPVSGGQSSGQVSWKLINDFGVTGPEHTAPAN